MDAYLKEAIKILNDIGCKYKITYGGWDNNPLWTEKEKRDFYFVNLETSKGEIEFKFWDSIFNTDLRHLDCYKFARKHYAYMYGRLSMYDAEIKWGEDRRKLKEPNIYDVMSCVTKYDPGSFEDFCCEYGYDDDSIRALKIYKAVCDEWQKMCQIFTEEDMEKLREIE